jgi:hypothetical protein
MRERILCLVLLGLVVAPVGVLAKGSVIDPNGVPARVAEVELITAIEKGAVIDPDGAPARAAASGPVTAIEGYSAPPVVPAPSQWGELSRSLDRFGLSA